MSTRSIHFLMGTDIQTENKESSVPAECESSDCVPLSVTDGHKKNDSQSDVRAKREMVYFFLGFI